MIITIARKEFIEMWRDGSFRVAAILLFCLLIVALTIGWRSHSSAKSEREAAQRITRQQWLAQGDKNPHAAAHYGVYAFKPKLPPSFLDAGIEQYTGVAVWLEAHKQNEFRYRAAQDATALQRFGELSAATILQIIIPLLIVLLTFSAFVGERERGTLRHLLSLGVSRRVLVCGKALGIVSLLALLLVPATAITIMILTLLSPVSDLTASGPRLLMMLIGYLFYFGIIILLSLIVSALAPSSRVALVILLGGWIFNCLIAPKAVADISKHLYPTPYAYQFAKAVQDDVKNGMDGHNPQPERLEALKARVLKQYGVTKLEDLPINFDGVRLQEGEEFGYQVFDKHYGGLWQTFHKQLRLQNIASIVAPLLAMRSLSMSLAGSDFAHQEKFAIAAEQYRRDIAAMMNNDIMQNSRTGQRDYTAGAQLWQQMPEFNYQVPTIGWVVKQQLWNIVVLAGWLLISTVILLFIAEKTEIV